MKRFKQHAIWGHRGTFILAATGSAVGLGNIWKFPYVTGENGGGAFVLMYLVCVAIIGIPIMIAEILVGRRARANPITSVQTVSRDSGLLRGWNVIGWMGVIAAFLILSYYTVIAGWTLEYFTLALDNRFAGLDGEASGNIFDELLANRSQLVQWQTAFISMTALILMFGVNKGLEAAVRVMMPVLFLLLLLLLAYAIYAGDFAAGLRFLFSFHPEDLSVRGALIALGHAFFTLSLGMAAIMAYGAYMPSTSAIGKTAVTVALLDTTVALVAGLAIFPLVFATPDITPSEGPGLMFVTLPIAFGAMPWGNVFGSAFFALVILAAWSSTISLLEPAVAYLTERFRFHRISASLLIALGAWLLGLGTVFSFNVWVDKKILWDLNFFGLIDFLTTNVMLPLGGLLTAIYVGWRVKRELIEHELKLDSTRFIRIWYWLLRYISPLAVLAVLLGGLYPVLKNFFGES
ncbi:sodium-dependent transporter [Cellvibrio sp. ARAG 10.3]|uniref:sodium-dependent transporter n=1 Tax=Cellvibrio sp. ARAG 10.3 TaxID=3451358 RepID=UPI003F47880A